MFQQQQQQQQQQKRQDALMMNQLQLLLEPTPIGQVQAVQRIENLPMDLMMNCEEYIAALNPQGQLHRQGSMNTNNIMDTSSAAASTGTSEDNSNFGGNFLDPLPMAGDLGGGNNNNNNGVSGSSQDMMMMMMNPRMLPNNKNSMMMGGGMNNMKKNDNQMMDMNAWMSLNNL